MSKRTRTAVKVVEDDDETIRFLPGESDLSRDPRLACLAACVVNQQAAGFGNTVDIREVHCPDCNASGFNTGWGFWRFSCGAEWLTDGEPSTPCGATKPSEGGA